MDETNTSNDNQIDLQELQQLIERVQTGESTLEEDAFFMHSLRQSNDLMIKFLELVKVEQLRQNLSK